jgi:hypothetical protein
MSNGPIEPNADMRMLANALRQMFLALIQEGFNEHQAMQIIGVTPAANISGGGA